jgi:hypothetical protein
VQKKQKSQNNPAIAEVENEDDDQAPGGSLPPTSGQQLQHKKAK